MIEEKEKEKRENKPMRVKCFCEHVGNKKLIFVIPSSYNELLEITAHCSNHSNFFSFSLFAVVCFWCFGC